MAFFQFATTVPILSSLKIDTSASGDLIVASGVADKTVRLYRLILVAAGATNITFKDAATALTGGIPLNAGGAVTLDLDGEPWFSSSAGNALIINNSAAVQISGRAYYLQS